MSSKKYTVGEGFAFWCWMRLQIEQDGWGCDAGHGWQCSFCREEWRFISVGNRP